MIYYDRIDVSERISVNKTTELNVCNRCHDLLMMSMNLRHIAILNIKSANYCCIISRISKSEAID